MVNDQKVCGTGLGLSICKQISHLMDGDIRAESEVNKGSIFHFTKFDAKRKERALRRNQIQGPNSPPTVK